jgi:7-cyano-7-deazaguanine synthase
MPQKVVVIYSGGMDSFTVLHKAIADGHEVYALSFNYGQRHVKELVCAKSVCEELGVPHKVVDISAINQLLAGSSLMAPDSTHEDIQIPEINSGAKPQYDFIILSRRVCRIAQCTRCVLRCSLW